MSKVSTRLCCSVESYHTVYLEWAVGKGTSNPRTFVWNTGLECSRLLLLWSCMNHPLLNLGHESCLMCHVSVENSAYMYLDSCI